MIILPGIIFDLDEQCRLAMGPHSVYCFLADEPPIVNKEKIFPSLNWDKSNLGCLQSK